MLEFWFGKPAGGETDPKQPTSQFLQFVPHTPVRGFASKFGLIALQPTATAGGRGRHGASTNSYLNTRLPRVLFYFKRSANKGHHSPRNKDKHIGHVHRGWSFLRIISIIHHPPSLRNTPLHSTPSHSFSHSSLEFTPLREVYCCCCSHLTGLRLCCCCSCCCCARRNYTGFRLTPSPR